MDKIDFSNWGKYDTERFNMIKEAILNKNAIEFTYYNSMAYRIYDEFESSEITKKEDGNFIIKVKYPENEWIYSYILSFGEYAKVLKPIYVKNIIKDKLQKNLKNYL